jgi:hypothetical protein
VTILGNVSNRIGAVFGPCFSTDICPLVGALAGGVWYLFRVHFQTPTCVSDKPCAVVEAAVCATKQRRTGSRGASVRGSRMKYLGTIAVVADAMQMRPLSKTVVLDATDAIDDLLDAPDPARIIVVPRNGNGGSFTLHAEEIDLRMISRR